VILLRDAALFCLEKDCAETGILPRAFSDMPRSCIGTLSSAADDEAIDETRDSRSRWEGCDTAGRTTSSSVSSSSSPDKQIVLSVLCSLLNTVIKYNSTSWRLPYDHVVWKDSRQSLVVYSMHVLLVLLLYPIPEDGRGPPPKNFYRHFLGRLHRPEDFQFLADGMTRILSQPMQATTTFLPGSQKSVQWAPEMIMLFWEVLQCNKRFRSFIIESNRAHDFVILMLFYAIEYKSDPTRQGIVRMCVFVLQTMSVEPAFGKNLNKKFEAQDTLPPSIRIPNFRGSYSDFLIVSINTLITTSKGKLDATYPALLDPVGKGVILLAERHLHLYHLHHLQS
jgi:hypothetical protein